MRKKSSSDGRDENDNQTFYIYGSEKEGFTKVTYGTSTGTSYEYTPPARDARGRFILDDFGLDPLRPRSVEEDESGEW